MSNALIPRQTIHEWSEFIADHPENHQTSLQRVLRSQRRLTRFIEENQASMSPATVGVGIYMTGVVARMFDMAGGRLKSATWAQIREASATVQGHLDALLPLGDGFVDRFHAIPRAQAHILDEAAMVLFQSDREEEDEQLDQAESLKVLLLTWVITEVLDRNWQPPAGFEGESEYAYFHIEPTPAESEKQAS